IFLLLGLESTKKLKKLEEEQRTNNIDIF
ncbi:MAG: hypothetical protein RLY15_1105, partial [Bacteroidota bacterium]